MNRTVCLTLTAAYPNRLAVYLRTCRETPPNSRNLAPSTGRSPVTGLSRQGKAIPSTENRQQPRTMPKLQHPCNSGTKPLRKMRRETTAVIRREAKGQECWIGNHRCFAAHHSSPSCRGSDCSDRTHRQRPTQNHRRLFPATRRKRARRAGSLRRGLVQRHDR